MTGYSDTPLIVTVLDVLKDVSLKGRPCIQLRNSGDCYSGAGKIWFCKQHLGL